MDKTGDYFFQSTDLFSSMMTLARLFNGNGDGRLVRRESHERFRCKRWHPRIEKGRCLAASTVSIYRLAQKHLCGRLRGRVINRC